MTLDQHYFDILLQVHRWDSGNLYNVTRLTDDLIQHGYLTVGVETRCSNGRRMFKDVALTEKGALALVKYMLKQFGKKGM